MIMKRDTKDYWFRYEGIYGKGTPWRFAKPVCWQRWTCLGIFLLVFFII